MFRARRRAVAAHATCATPPAASPDRVRHEPDCAQRCAGFTLVEVLVATTLSAVLLVGTAAVAGMFSESVAVLSKDIANDHEAAMARIASDIHYAWWVEVPRSNVLAVAAHTGDITTYTWNGYDLLVTLPSGEEGVLCSGVTQCLFEPQLVDRWREGTPAVRGRTLYSKPNPMGIALPIDLEDTGTLAISFALDSNEGEGTVAGVNERLLLSHPTSIQVPIAVGETGGSIEATLYRARAPGDPRALAGEPAIGSFVMPLTALPTSARSMLYQADPRLPAPPGKVRVSPRFQAPTSLVAFDVGSSVPRLDPGVAYTLHLKVSGGAGISVLAGYPAWGTSGNVAFRDDDAQSLASQPLVVPVTITGNATVTSTSSSEEVIMVKTTLAADGGRTLTRSAGVYGQVVAEEPWLGVVAGEAAPSRGPR